MQQKRKSVHLSTHLITQLKRKAVNESTTIKDLVTKAVQKSLAPTVYSEGY